MTDLSLNIYLPFEKRNDEERIVEGYASTEAVDSQGEVIRAEAIEKALPDYMKYANIREMHQLSAVGKTLSAQVDKSKKGCKIVAKVVDDNAWIKVKEGVYNGFSIGGRVLKRVGNVIQELILNEISLVDRPANPEAVFSLVKMQDGKVVEKNGIPLENDEGPTDTTGWHIGVSLATEFTEWADEVARAISMCESLQRPNEHLTSLLGALKAAAIKELEMDKVAKADEEPAKAPVSEAEILSQLKDAKAKLENIVANKQMVDMTGYNDKYYTKTEEVKKNE